MVSACTSQRLVAKSLTLVREFESNDMRDVIRRMFVRQTKINCSPVSEPAAIYATQRSTCHQRWTENWASMLEVSRRRLQN